MLPTSLVPYGEAVGRNLPDSPREAGLELTPMAHMTAASPLLLAALGSSSMRQFYFRNTKGDLWQAAAEGWEQL